MIPLNNQKAEYMIVASAKLPIRLVWASSIFLLVGGGRYAAEMILAAMVAKACNEETRYEPNDQSWRYGSNLGSR